MKISNKVLAFVLLGVSVMNAEGMIPLADFVESCNSAGEAPLVLGKTDLVSGETDFEISGKRRQVEAKLKKVENLAKANMMECEVQELDHDGSGKDATFVQHVTFVQWAQERIAAETARREEIKRKEEEERATARRAEAARQAEATERNRVRREARQEAAARRAEAAREEAAARQAEAAERAEAAEQARREEEHRRQIEREQEAQRISDMKPIEFYGVMTLFAHQKNKNYDGISAAVSACVSDVELKFPTDDKNRRDAEVVRVAGVIIGVLLRTNLEFDATLKVDGIIKVLSCYQHGSVCNASKEDIEETFHKYCRRVPGDKGKGKLGRFRFSNNF